MKKLIIIFVILNSFQIVSVAQTTIKEVKNDTTTIYTVDKKGYVTNIEIITPEIEKSKTNKGENYTTCPQTTTTTTTPMSQEKIERKKRNKQRRKVLGNATIDALLGTGVIIMQDSYRTRGY